MYVNFVAASFFIVGLGFVIVGLYQKFKGGDK